MLFPTPTEDLVVTEKMTSSMWQKRNEQKKIISLAFYTKSLHRIQTDRKEIKKYFSPEKICFLIAVMSKSLTSDPTYLTQLKLKKKIPHLQAYGKKFERSAHKCLTMNRIFC